MKEYPILTRRPDLARLAGALLFPCLVDPVTLRPVMSTHYGAHLEGEEFTPQYRAKAFFDEFRSRVFDFTLSDWNHWLGKAREVIAVDPTAAVHEAARREVSTDPSARSLLLGSGACVGRRTTAKARLESAAAARRVPHSVSAAANVAAYLNAVAPNAFTTLASVSPSAAVASDSLPDLSRAYNRNLLSRILLQPQPFYGPSEGGKTVRLFPMCPGITNLSRPVRHTLCAGLTEIDIKHTHFTLNSHLWNAPEIMQYIESVPDLWLDLIAWVVGTQVCGITCERLKGVIKPAAYCIFYGADARCVEWRLGMAMKDIGVAKARRFVDHPLISRLLVCREAAYAKVERDGGAGDCFGRFISIDPETTAASVLAQLAQALELYCMSAVIDVANTTADFRIVLWLHDGITVAFSRRAEANSRRICDAVINRAGALGIPVRLSVTHLEGGGEGWRT